MSALVARRTLEATVATPAQIPFDAVLAGQTPMVFRGLARDWPLVQEGLKSAQAVTSGGRWRTRARKVAGAKSASLTAAPVPVPSIVACGSSFSQPARVSGLWKAKTLRARGSGSRPLVK